MHTDSQSKLSEDICSAGTVQFFEALCAKPQKETAAINAQPERRVAVTFRQEKGDGQSTAQISPHHADELAAVVTALSKAAWGTHHHPSLRLPFLIPLIPGGPSPEISSFISHPLRL
ncbi:hypothetical protein Vafri_12684 [Volvox africanus]|uniref:Uncharacterized protein n=1 Tax=Volvox africanus TaxID=51714 RepID=A0A8J4BB19_9CHLO|nr:hypothetical protein Vafri_12684 [Volvox africanus]